MVKPKGKILPLLFFIVALTMFGSIKPMKKLFCCFPLKKRCSDPCKPLGTKITDLPSDYLVPIFQYFVNRNDVKSKSFVLVMLVCKWFKKVIDENPFFLVDDLRYSSGDPLFLFYPLKRCGNTLYNVTLDEENVAKFLQSSNLGKLVQIPIELSINSNRISSYNNKSYLNRDIFFSGKDNRLEVDGCSSFTGALFTYLKNLEDLKVKCSTKLNEKNFEYLTNLQRLIVCCIEFTGAGLEELRNLQSLSIICCFEFDEKWLKGLQKLKTLNVRDLDRFIGTTFKDLQNLDTLKVERCKNFYPNGFNNLKYLKNMQSFLLEEDFLVDGFIFLDPPKNFQECPFFARRRINEFKLPKGDWKRTLYEEGPLGLFSSYITETWWWRKRAAKELTLLNKAQQK